MEQIDYKIYSLSLGFKYDYKNYKNCTNLLYMAELNYFILDISINFLPFLL